MSYYLVPMAETLNSRTKETLRNYLREVRTLPNESARRQRFSALIGELFPGTSAITDFARGVEKIIRIKRSGGEKRGRADAYYGNAIIEFEKSLKATLHDAEGQLQEYVSGLWPKKEEGLRSLIAIASDGTTWRIYRPRLKPGASSEPVPDDINLDLLREFRLSDETLGAFWLWLTSLLFRPQQVEPTPERFQIDFGRWSPLYREGTAELEKAWVEASDEPETRLAFETWQRYLTVTYGKLAESVTPQEREESGVAISELENLFLRHTYLSCIARLLIWASLSQGKAQSDLGEIAREVFSGDYFKSKRLANLVDDDFFHWIRHDKVERILTPVWERIISHMQEYDLAHLDQDVLKGVYEQLIDPKDRHDLGEYYTPDWLCERIVEELLPHDGFKPVLDPSCGSGSFLRAAITHYLNQNTQGTENERLRAVLANVKGIDIHPVAVTISRATYVLALGPLVKAARKPIQLPVYLADSLFLPREVEEDLINRLTGIEITFGQSKDRRHVVMPHTLVHSPELFDEAIAACTTVADDHAKTQQESVSTMEHYLSKTSPELGHLLGYEGIRDALWQFTVDLAELIRSKKNSIWSFIVRNSYRPAMFREQFDLIIGNPPWLSYRYIADPDYQQEIKERAINRYSIAPKSQKLFTQMELATVFLAHCMATFARPKAKLSFVMPRSILSADQHQKLIKREYHSPFRITGYWDLWGIFPLFNFPASVLFVEWDKNHGNPSDPVPARTWQGKLSERNASWTIAKSKLKSVEGTGRVIYLGQRCAFSTQSGSTSPTKPSKYQKVFRQGATIVPRSFYFVRIPDLEETIDPEGQYWAETDPVQATEAKKPYKGVRLSGLIEGKFIYSSALAKHLLPFVVLEPAVVALPIEEKGGRIEIHPADDLIRAGHREFGKWMKKAEEIWQDRRGTKAGKQNPYERIDFQRELTHQSISQRHLVLYNAAGTNISAAHYDRNDHKLPLIVEHKLYWAAVSDWSEAEFLVAFLNAKATNEAIKPFQSTGLMGERDIEKKVLDLPIPAYDHENPVHQALSALGERARKEALVAVEGSQFPTRSTLARKRAFVRTQLAGTLREIDELVKTLLLQEGKKLSVQV